MEIGQLRRVGLVENDSHLCSRRTKCSNTKMSNNIDLCNTNTILFAICILKRHFVDGCAMKILLYKFGPKTFFMVGIFYHLNTLKGLGLKFQVVMFKLA